MGDWLTPVPRVMTMAGAPEIFNPTAAAGPEKVLVPAGDTTSILIAVKPAMLVVPAGVSTDAVLVTVAAAEPEQLAFA